MAHAARGQAGLALEGPVELVDLAGIEAPHRAVAQARPDADLDQAAVFVHRLWRQLVADLVEPVFEKFIHGPLRSWRCRGVDLGKVL